MKSDVKAMMKPLSESQIGSECETGGMTVGNSYVCNHTELRDAI